MPAKDVTVPSTLTGEAKKVWLKIYEAAWDGWSSKKTKKTREAYSAAVAWAGLKKAGFHKAKDGDWVKKSRAAALNHTLRLRITKAKTDKQGVVHWHAQAANDEVDGQEEALDPTLFDDLAENFNTTIKTYSKGENPPDFGRGPALLPILDLSHYSAIIPVEERDKARLGPIEKLYRDGRYLHAAGTFDDTPLGRLSAKAVLANEDNMLKTSVGFYPDWGNILIENDVLHFRGGREPPKAYLDHIAITTVPRIESTTIEASEGGVTMSDSEVVTVADDALQVLGEGGEGIVKELEDLAGEMKGKSMVLMSEEETDEQIQKAAPVGGPAVCVCPDCGYEAKKERGVPCRDMKCPECDVGLVAGDSKEKSDTIPSEDVKVEPTELEEKSDVSVPMDSDVVPARPYGGASSFKDALDYTQVTKESFRIQDGWSVFNQVVDNIFADEEIEDKSAAIDKALTEFQVYLKSDEEVWSGAGQEDDVDTVEVEEIESVKVIDSEATVEASVATEDPVVVKAAPIIREKEPPEASPMSEVDLDFHEGKTPLGGVAKSFGDALSKLEAMDVSPVEKRQTAKKLVNLADSQIQEALTSPADIESMVTNAVEGAIENVRSDLAELRELLRARASVDVERTEPDTPRRPQRKSFSFTPNISPAKVTTEAQTFSGIVDSLLGGR